MVELLMGRVDGAGADGRRHHGHHGRRRGHLRRRRLVRLPHWISNVTRTTNSDQTAATQERGIEL